MYSPNMSSCGPGEPYIYDFDERRQNTDGSVLIRWDFLKILPNRY
jgi:hypothetical protein